MAAQKINKEGKKLQKSYFDVLGLCCSSEVPLVENILKSLEGVMEISVIVPTKTVIVVHDNLVISQIQIGKFPLNFDCYLHVNLSHIGNFLHIYMQGF